jgi:hypothetical protein
MAAPDITSGNDALTAINKRLEELGFDPKYVGFKGSLNKSVKQLSESQKKIKGKSRIDTERLQKEKGRAWASSLTPEQRQTISAYREYDTAREDLARRAAESLNTPKGSAISREEAARKAVDELARTEREGQDIGVPTAPTTEPAPQDSYDPEKMKQWLDKTIAERRALRNVAGPSETPKSQTTESPSSTDPARVGASFKRQLLADEVKRFAGGGSKETAESLIEQGGEVGVSREQLSNLYKQYRAESEKGPTKLDGGSMFEQEEEQARARSKASGAFGGDDWRGRSSANSVSTPDLDQYASDAFGARPMGSERRVITSPEGQMRLIARKADRAGININSLISANKGDVAASFDALEAAGFSPKGIRSEEEVRARPELAAQQREARAEILRRQAAQARVEREAAERAAKEEADRKEADRIAKEEAARKEAERLAKEEEDRKEKERLAKEEEARKEAERSSQQGTSNPNSTQLTDSSSETSNPNSRPLRDSSPKTANPNSRPTNPNRRG